MPVKRTAWASCVQELVEAHSINSELIETLYDEMIEVIVPRTEDPPQRNWQEGVSRRISYSQLSQPISRAGWRPSRTPVHLE